MYLELYEYAPIHVPVLDKQLAEKIMNASSRNITYKMGYAEVSVARIDREILQFQVMGKVYELSVDVLKGIRGGDKLYAVLGDGKLVPLEVRGSSYYKLYPTSPSTPPTLEIDGIHMHRITGSDPHRDTLAKINAARIRRGSRVLDTCMGLGYTAIYSLDSGASLVVSFEVSEEVLLLAEYNPWSWRLSDARITILHNDVTEAIHYLPEGYFDRVIHDPPRLTSSTGDLYSRRFYGELYRVMKPGGILFHYTGEPGKLRRINLPGRVASRLKETGFIVKYYDGRARGVVAVRPR